MADSPPRVDKKAHWPDGSGSKEAISVKPIFKGMRRDKVQAILDQEKIQWNYERADRTIHATRLLKKGGWFTRLDLFVQIRFDTSDKVEDIEAHALGSGL